MALYLILSIMVSVAAGFLLVMMGPVVGGIIAFGIVAGSLFRGLYLLHDLHNRLSKVAPKQDKAKEAYENYLQGRENQG
ncbi:hypothetical protein [Salibacterium sp. K-3]